MISTNCSCNDNEPTVNPECIYHGDPEFRTNQIAEIRKLWGPRKQYDIWFADFPDVNTFLNAIPVLLDRIDVLEEVRSAAEMLRRLLDEDYGMDKVELTMVRAALIKAAKEPK